MNRWWKEEEDDDEKKKSLSFQTTDNCGGAYSVQVFQECVGFYSEQLKRMNKMFRNNEVVGKRVV